MNFVKTIEKIKRGSAIAYGLVIIAVVSILFTSIIQFIASQMKYSSYVASRDEALNIAEAGANFYRWYLYHNIEEKTIQQIIDFWEDGDPIAVGTPACGEPGAYEAEFKDPSGSAVGKYCLEVTPPHSWETMATVKSVGWTYKYPEAKRTIQLRLRRPAWSEYMVLADGMFRLSDRTEIWGKMHSNTGIHFDGVIHNLISNEVAQYWDVDYSAWKPGIWTVWADEHNDYLNNDVFMLGKIYPNGHHDFNSVVGNFGVMADEADDTNTNFSNLGEGRRIILNGDTFDICTVNSYNGSTYEINNYKRTSNPNRTCSSCDDSRCKQTFNIPDNGVIYVNDNVWLEGQVDGKKITIAAYDDVAGDRNIYLYNNLKYTHYDGTDIIGVMAQNDIEIIRDSLNVLRLDGAFLAKDGRLGRRNYGNTKSSVTVFGSIATNGRINFGYTDGTGYTNRYLYFDNNLIYDPPPYFPTGSEILVDLWEEL
jgi:hypothetical protein